MKLCTKCKKMKEFTAFSPDKQADGRHSWCIKCVGDHIKALVSDRVARKVCVRCELPVVCGKQRCQAHLDYANRRNTEKWYRRRLQVYAGYGGKCVCCSESNPAFLSLDHVNNDGWSHRKQFGRNINKYYRWILDNNFPRMLQLLCMNCNFGKMRNKGMCPHGNALLRESNTTSI